MTKEAIEKDLESAPKKAPKAKPVEEAPPPKNASLICHVKYVQFKEAIKVHNMTESSCSADKYNIVALREGIIVIRPIVAPNAVAHVPFCNCKVWHPT